MEQKEIELVNLFTNVPNFHAFAPLLAIAAISGGGIGSFFGSRRLPVAAVIKSLVVVLVIAGVKLLLI